MTKGMEQPPKKTNKQQEIDSVRLKPEVARDLSYSEGLRKQLIEKGVYDENYFKDMEFDFDEYKNTKKRIENAEKILKEGSSEKNVEPEEIEELKKELEEDKKKFAPLERAFFEKKTAPVSSELKDPEKTSESSSQKVGVLEKNNPVDLDIAVLEKQIKEFDKEMLDRDITKMKQSEVDALSKKGGDLHRRLEELEEIKSGVKNNKKNKKNNEGEAQKTNEETLSIPKGRVNLGLEKEEISKEDNTQKNPKITSHTAQWTGGVEFPKKEEEPPVIIHTEPQIDNESGVRVEVNRSSNPEVSREHVTPAGGAGVPPTSTVEVSRNTPTPERAEKKTYTADQARKALDILCGNSDFSLITYNASAEDRALLGDILKKDWRTASPDDKKKVLPLIERTFTQRVVDKALELQEIKEARENVRADALKHAKEKGISYEDAMGIMRSGLREGDRAYSLLEQSNRFEPTLKELKKLMLVDKAAALEEEFKGHGYTPEQINDILVEKLVTGEKTRIFNEKKGEYEEADTTNSYEQLLLKMTFREQQADQRKIEEIYNIEKMRHPGVFKKVVGSLARIPRPWRSAIIGAAVAGGALPFGLGAGAAAAMSVPVYLGYRAIRSATGGMFGYYLQKWIGEKAVDAAFSSDMRKIYKETVEARTEELTRDEELKSLVLERNFDAFAEKNYEYGKALDEEFRKKEAVANKYRKWNRGLMTFVTGVIGGGLGARLVDWGAEAAIGSAVVPGVEQATGPKASEHIPEQPTHIEDIATAHKGDSVWRLIEEDASKNIKGFSNLNEAQRTYFIDHLKDQVVADPHKFGLENADQIKIGYGKELQSLFENNSDIEKTLDIARSLSKGQMDSIIHSNMAQRAELFEHAQQTPSLEEIVVTGRGGASSVDLKPIDTSASETLGGVATVKGISEHGFESVRGMPLETIQDKELAQTLLNFKGNPNLVEGSELAGSAKDAAAKHLVELADQHPEYMKIGGVRDALREIHTNNLVDELHEGGAFKFLNSADHEDLFRETTGLAKTYGLDGYRSQSFAEFISQGHEMNEQTFSSFTDPDSGLFLSDRFQDAIKQFHSLEVMTDLPKIPNGATESLWEPRLISVNGADPIVGLVKQTSSDLFEYRTPTGLMGNNVLKEAMDKMIVRPPSK